jgi:hypothetical protein
MVCRPRWLPLAEDALEAAEPTTCRPPLPLVVCALHIVAAGQDVRQRGKIRVGAGGERKWEKTIRESPRVLQKEENLVKAF